MCVFVCLNAKNSFMPGAITFKRGGKMGDHSENVMVMIWVTKRVSNRVIITKHRMCYTWGNCRDNRFCNHSHLVLSIRIQYERTSFSLCVCLFKRYSIGEGFDFLDMLYSFRSTPMSVCPCEVASIFSKVQDLAAAWCLILIWYDLVKKMTIYLFFHGFGFFMQKFITYDKTQFGHNFSSIAIFLFMAWCHASACLTKFSSFFFKKSVINPWITPLRYSR